MATEEFLTSSPSVHVAASPRSADALCSVLHALGRVHLAGAWLNARIRLRGATLQGRRVVLHGRARISNRGAMVIGDRVRLYSEVSTLELATLPGGRLEIGNNVSINHGTTISASRLVRIGHNCMIGVDAMLIDCDFHRVEDKSWDTDGQPIIVEDNAWIGNRCIILKGVTIGHDSVVAAGSVVSRDVPPRTMVFGVPARVVKQW